MKRKAMTLLMVLMTVVCGFAGPKVPSAPNPPKETPVLNGRLEKNSSGSKRPRIPSKIYLEYQYNGKGIFIIAPDSYSEIGISVTGTDVFYGNLNVDNGFYLETGTLQGSYIIVCTTQDGSVFSGEMNIE